MPALVSIRCRHLHGRPADHPQQVPGAIDRMRDSVCTRFRGVHLVEGAGHWVQFEAAERFNQLIAEFAAVRSNG